MVGGDGKAWVCIPTAVKDHVVKQLEKWRAKGYKIAVLTDGSAPAWMPHYSDAWLHVDQYPGVWQSWNILAQAVLRLGAGAAVLVGDDMDPDPNKTGDEILAEYLQRFPDGFGIMQPCGDMQGDLINGVPNSGRICGSPWVGRGWIRRSYYGRGPVNASYTAFYADEELKLVAERLGILWMRPDLTQFHRHWSWRHLPKQEYHDRNQASWQADKAIFEAHRDAKFDAATPISDTARSC